MSGSGGSGYGGGFDVPETSCEDFVLHTAIGSPQRDVVTSLVKGSRLSVEVHMVNAISTVVVLFNGRVAGGIGSPKIVDLRKCLERGYKFEAVVTDVSGDVTPIADPALLLADG